MSVDMVLHAMKSLVFVKLLVWFYFLSLFMQILYFVRIEETDWFPFRLTEPHSASRSHFVDPSTMDSQQSLKFASTESGSKDEGVESLSFSLERIKTDDWHRLVGYEPKAARQKLPRIVNLPGTASSRHSLDNRTVYFLHIHKSAGTSMCFAARINHMSTAPTNCNPQSDQRCCGGSDTLEAQQNFAAASQYNFVANEGYMYEAMDEQNYRYVLMLRNSRERYRSHWKNVVFLNPSEISFPDWWQRQPDNWNLRVACGSRCMNVSKFQLTPALFNYTLERIKRFDNILLVERYNETFGSFAKQVGWRYMPLPHQSRTTLPYAPFKWNWDPLMSALDDAMYEFAESKFESNTQPGISSARMEAVKSYFTNGPSRMCSNPCCHEFCSPY